MARKPTITIVGPGRLGRAVALQLRRAGYGIREVISRNTAGSRRKGHELARKVGARAVVSKDARLDADLVWFCVPDRGIAEAAAELAQLTTWRKKVAFHASGALASDELNALRRRGAVVAAVHPLMTFVRGSDPSLQDVAFAIEGDAAAVRLARRIARDLGGEAFLIPKSKKAVYHAWCGFTSPLLVAALVTAEQVARVAGMTRVEARKRLVPIVRQTLANYAALGPAAAFSGPIGRGDAEVVRKHLRVLAKAPVAREVYLALARAALRYLPARNRKELDRMLHG